MFRMSPRLAAKPKVSTRERTSSPRPMQNAYRELKNKKVYPIFNSKHRAMRELEYVRSSLQCLPFTMRSSERRCVVRSAERVSEYELYENMRLTFKYNIRILRHTLIICNK